VLYEKIDPNYMAANPTLEMYAVKQYSMGVRKKENPGSNMLLKLLKL